MNLANSKQRKHNFNDRQPPHKTHEFLLGFLPTFLFQSDELDELLGCARIT